MTTRPDTQPDTHGAEADAALPGVLGGFDLTDQARWAEGIPYDTFAALRRHAPVLFHPPGRMPDGEGFWVLSRHADIGAAATHPALSSQGGGGRDGGGTHLEDLAMGVHAGALLPMMDDPRHDLVARLLGPTVGRAAVERIVPELRAYAGTLVDDLLTRDELDLPADLAGPYAIEAMALILGIPAPDRPQLVRWLDAVVGIVGRRSAVPDEPTRQVNGEIVAYCRSLLAARAADPGDDVASVVATGELPDDAAAAGEGPLTPYERELNFLLFLQTGSEQPRNALAGGLLALAENPGQWQALREDRSLVPRAVEEMLRWTPGSPYNRRTATEDLELSGMRIRAGDKVTLWWASANRDADVFTDPDVFDVRREHNPHLSFGFGMHSCMGARVARVELGVLLDALLDRVAGIQATGPVRWAPSNKHAVMVDQPVRLVPAR